MTELKTLKDFKHGFGKNLRCKLCGTRGYFIDGFMDDGITPCKIVQCPNDKMPTESYFFPILRQEAIKWIKRDLETINSEIKRLRKTNTLTKSGFKEECNEHLREEYARIEWIKHFFNITKKDLK